MCRSFSSLLRHSKAFFALFQPGKDAIAIALRLIVSPSILQKERLLRSHIKEVMDHFSGANVVSKNEIFTFLINGGRSNNREVMVLGHFVNNREPLDYLKLGIIGLKS